jgi:hypothetical protein
MWELHLAAYVAVREEMTDWFIRMAEEEAVHRRWVQKVGVVGDVLRLPVVGVIGLIVVRLILLGWGG